MTDKDDKPASTTTSQQAPPSTGPAVPRRLENTTACVPIVYGSCAFYLGKKADEFQTHQWTLYLRGPNGDEDLSAVISKVIFQLHASFAQPMRELTEPPFEVTERGWGEFEAQIRIVWKDPSEKSTVVAHGIRLYPPGTPANTVPTETNVPVVAETYDEVVFTDPTEAFFQQMKKLAALPPVEYSQREHFGKFSDDACVQALLEAQKFLQSELATTKERLLLVDQDLDQVDEALRQAAESAQARANKRSATSAPHPATTPVMKKAKT